MELNKIYNGNNLDILKTFPDNSIDSIVTDPPYGLGKEPNALEVLQSWITTGYNEVKGKGFMGKEWDSFVPQPIFWKECLRVLKPGGHLLSFAGTRTYDWMVMGLRLAGFEIRDQIAWIYGSGFPKSHDISKAIDKKGGNPLIVDEISLAIKKARISRKLTMKYCDDKYCNGSTNWSWYEGRKGLARVPDVHTFNEICKDFTELTIYCDDIQELEREQIGTITRTKGVGIPAEGKMIDRSQYEHAITTPTSDNAKQWQGYGTALKPALEPIVMARKPLDGTVAINVLKHGVGGINIDGCRVETDDKTQRENNGVECGNRKPEYYKSRKKELFGSKIGRFPANVIHDGSEEVVKLFPSTEAGGSLSKPYEAKGNIYGDLNVKAPFEGYDDSGSAARFFYTAKASQSERNFGLYGFEKKQTTGGGGGIGNYLNDVNSASGKYGSEKAPSKNIHPTVKPIDLMRYLVRLVTPKNGICLDPFMGSGTTAVACKAEKFNYIGCELDEQYVKIAEARIKAEVVQYNIFDFMEVRDGTIRTI